MRDSVTQEPAQLRSLVCRRVVQVHMDPVAILPLGRHRVKPRDGETPVYLGPSEISCYQAGHQNGLITRRLNRSRSLRSRCLLPPSWGSISTDRNPRGRGSRHMVRIPPRYEEDPWDTYIPEGFLRQGSVHRSRVKPLTRRWRRGGARCGAATLAGHRQPAMWENGSNECGRTES
jgi:hypothetical protein